MSISRRQFIQGASAASLGLPLLVSSRAWGANDEIRVGVVGLGIRGTGAHIPGMAGQKGVKIAAVCDPDRTRSAAAAKLCEEHYQQKVTAAEMEKAALKRPLHSLTGSSPYCCADSCWLVAGKAEAVFCWPLAVNQLLSQRFW